MPKLTNAATAPLVALTMGDASGIGPELVARLLARPEWRAAARVVVVGDPWVWEAGKQVANLDLAVRGVGSMAEARGGTNDLPCFLAMDSATPSQVKIGEATPAAGKGALAVLEACLRSVQAGDVDAICFAPLNKYALKLGGMRFEDELHYFAHFFGVQGYFCEFNTLGDVWTARVSSHVPMADILKYVTVDRIKAAATLLHGTLLKAGLTNPRIAIAALNPHAGDGGTCGREEIDIIAPAIRQLNEAGIQVQGPFPADTIFLKARDGELDAVVTLYHDQGQIAIKLMGF